MMSEWFGGEFERAAHGFDIEAGKYFHVDGNDDLEFRVAVGGYAFFPTKDNVIPETLFGTPIEISDWSEVGKVIEAATK